MAVDFLTSAVLLAINVGFICLGGAAFNFLEKPRMERRIENYMNITKQLSALTEDDIDLIGQHCSDIKGVPWTYGQSFNYALSIITTVGWGVMSPSSFTTKATTCLYALLGIPIYMVFIALIKDKCGRLFRKTVQVPRDVSWYWIPLCITIVISLFMNITINMGMEFGKMELKTVMKMNCDFIKPFNFWQANASAWDGIYFGFITVSTIGFGDEYHKCVECEGQSLDSVCSAVAGFFLFSFLLGMSAHLFDVISERSQTGLSSLSSRISKRMGNGHFHHIY